MSSRPSRPFGLSFKALLFVGALVLIGAGCKDAPPPPPPTLPPEAQFDVTKTKCDEIEAARDKVRAAYLASLQAAGDVYAQAHALFQADLTQCLDGLWKGGPCDEQAKATQKAYENAWNDISNDQFYKEWKKAKADWDECYAHWDEKYADWAGKVKEREQRCQEEFQAKVDAAEAAYQAAAKVAKEKRDADYAFLDALEKKCKEQTTTFSGGVVIPNGATKNIDVKADTGGTTNPPGGGTTPPQVGVVPRGTVYRPGSTVCQDEIPGENGAPRQGQASDFGPRDILVGLLVTVAEDVTHNTVPTSAIDDKLFAVMVATKIRTRIAEMDKEAIDHITDNRWQRRYEQQRARYEQALSVWGAIAAGKTAVPQVKKDAAALNAMPSGACKTDDDCGTPICCSAGEIGKWSCDTDTGACHHRKEPCEDPEVCTGMPARCAEIIKVRAILFRGKYLPIDQLQIENESGCGADHWHAKAGVVTATDGARVSDPGPQCGYGKVNDMPVYEVEAAK
ncbi:MAG TPA: hypothetical protein VL426_06595 [Candidatus Binatia bacterium]|nr:hypothetical protein [Candidatus Binatia bacterium]